MTVAMYFQSSYNISIQRPLYGECRTVASDWRAYSRATTFTFEPDLSRARLVGSSDFGQVSVSWNTQALPAPGPYPWAEVPPAIVNAGVWVELYRDGSATGTIVDLGLNSTNTGNAYTAIGGGGGVYG